METTWLYRKCWNLEFFWSVVSRIRTKYAGGMREKFANKGKYRPNKLQIWTLFAQY